MCKRRIQMDSKEMFELAKKSGRRDEYEHSIHLRSDMLAAGIGALVCIALALVKLLAVRQFDYGVFTILFVIFGVQRILDWRAERKIVRLIFGIVFLLLATLFSILYISEVVGR